MRILNLYAGIGGNRKLWKECEVTAIEYDVNIAEVYHDYFPEDKLICCDAHKYLIDNFKSYDFIWSSPPCPTHSRLRTGLKKIVYPDMTLYQEIILLQKWFRGRYLVENVKPYYKPLVQPTVELQRHYFWCNFFIPYKDFETEGTCTVKGERKYLQEKYGYNLNKYKGIDRRKTLRNCVSPEIGKYILDRVKTPA